MSITLHFHPDWPHGDGWVIEAMARDAAYRGQFVTGVSNGLLAPTVGSERWRWESRLFNGRYDAGPAEHRPVYGSWNRRADPYGGSPRFGSAFFRLRPEAARRATYCYPDSTFDPEDVGGPDRLDELCRLADLTRVEEPLDDYVEAQVHGGVVLGRDVEALVLDPVHATGRVREAADRLGCAIEVHPGYRVATADLSDDYRGPEPPALLRSLGDEVTPDLLAAARRTDEHDPQVVKRAWHLLARFGRTEGTGTLGGMYPEVRAAVEADAGPDFRAPGFDLAAYREEVRLASLELPREDVAEVLDVDADGVPCRLHVPAGAKDGVVVHLHGGGFVFNDIDVHDGFSRRLANRCGRPVLSVDYRRPPEHPFPAAPDDVDTVLGWLGRQDLPGRWAVHGDSAGANLALVAALRHPGLFAAVALVYPFLEPRAGHPSYDVGAASGFDPAEARWYWEQYADESAWDDPDVAPLRSTRLATLPPTLVATAEHDPLRDEGEELARRLAEEGVETVGIRCLGQTHGFYRHDAFTASEPLVRQVSGFVDQHLA